MHSPTTRITFIGGGSVQWGPRLTTDLMLTQALTGSQLVLYDIDTVAAQRMGRLAQRIATEVNADWDVQVQDDLDRALNGSNFVIVSIAQGGLEAMRLDLEIPWRYGIAQPVGDTVGPGGISRALRHIPVALDIARRMEHLCPEAWFINLTNPLSPITRAVSRETRVRAIGLCHEVAGVLEDLAHLFKVEQPSTISARVAGVNHLPWILQMRVDGRDGFELLRQWLDTHGPFYFVETIPQVSTVESVFHDRMAVKFLLFQTYGCLAGASDRHVAEFFPVFLSAESDYGHAYGVELTTVEHRYELLERRQQLVAQQIAQSEPLELRSSKEQLAGVIAALAAGQPGHSTINICNMGQIDNLPRGAVVECQAALGLNGVEPLSVGSLPPGIAQTLAGRVEQQEIIVDAAVQGDPDLVLQALLADPMVPSWKTAVALREELLRVHAQHLPQFSHAGSAKMAARQA
ncbi:MAG: alpha-galacturonidase LplD [Anaerolineae bacterium]